MLPRTTGAAMVDAEKAAILKEICMYHEKMKKRACVCCGASLWFVCAPIGGKRSLCFFSQHRKTPFEVAGERLLAQGSRLLAQNEKPTCSRARRVTRFLYPRYDFIPFPFPFHIQSISINLRRRYHSLFPFFFSLERKYTAVAGETCCTGYSARSGTRPGWVNCPGSGWTA